MKQYVIIGNGVAAAGCIEGIRSADPNGAVTVVSAERHPVYCRPLISYYLEGKTDIERMQYRDAGFYEQNGCRVLYGKSAVRLDAAAKTVELDDGTILPYDSLCVAAGSSPFLPPLEGLETVEKTFTFMTLDDALALEAAVKDDSRVLIVGAGLIGLKCAEGLYNRAASITVCDLAGRVLSSVLDDECAARMQRHLEAHGIRFLLGDSVRRLDGKKAYMNGGAVVDFDVLVLAVGVRANTALVCDAGGETNRGILVDESMRTSLPDVYAAGDCTEGEDVSLGGRRVLAILPNAYMQGHCAGVCMAGGRETFDKAIPMNAVGFFGLHAMTAGTYYGEADGGSCYEEQDEHRLKRLFMRDGRLTGFILIGETERAGIYTSLIRERTPLDSIRFDLLKKVATSAAFLPEIRRKKFGGVV